MPSDRWHRHRRLRTPKVGRWSFVIHLSLSDHLLVGATRWRDEEGDAHTVVGLGPLTAEVTAIRWLTRAERRHHDDEYVELVTPKLIAQAEAYLRGGADD